MTGRALSRPFVRLVECPECGAAAGEHCVGARDRERIANHQPRVDLAYSMSSKRTLTVGEDGLLRDAAGVAIGHIVSIELVLVDKHDSLTEGGGVEGQAVDVGSDPKERTLANARPREKVPAADVRRVWDHYVSVVHGGSTRMGLDSTRSGVIKSALKARPIETVLLAVEGLSRSPHHNGQNDQQRKYLEIRFALRGNRERRESDDERIDKMAELASRHGASPDLPSATDARINNYLEQVRTALEYPDSEQARTQGKKAHEKLKGMGFVVKRQGLRVWVDRP